MSLTANAQIAARIRYQPFTHPLTVATTLEHFAMITYHVPVERVRSLVPERFDIHTQTVNGLVMALVSVVNFVDRDFRFVKAPFLKFSFGQTNYRTYVVDKQNGEQVAWFFGTSVGSVLGHIPRHAWNMPWHTASYQSRFERNVDDYTVYDVKVTGSLAAARLVLHETHPGPIPEGLDALILLYPMKGYYYKRNGTLGHYRIWHGTLPVRTGACQTAYFSLLESLSLLSKAEMQQPVSVLLCNEVAFEIALPPQTLENR